MIIIQIGIGIESAVPIKISIYALLQKNTTTVAVGRRACPFVMPNAGDHTESPLHTQFLTVFLYLKGIDKGVYETQRFIICNRFTAG